MARKGNPYDNAMMESFIKTLKAEEVYLAGNIRQWLMLTGAPLPHL
jgi:transposase InsO family protein